MSVKRTQSGEDREGNSTELKIVFLEALATLFIRSGQPAIKGRRSAGSRDVKGPKRKVMLKSQL